MSEGRACWSAADLYRTGSGIADAGDRSLRAGNQYPGLKVRTDGRRSAPSTPRSDRETNKIAGCSRAHPEWRPSRPEARHPAARCAGRYKPRCGRSGAQDRPACRRSPAMSPRAAAIRPDARLRHHPAEPEDLSGECSDHGPRSSVASLIRHKFEQRAVRIAEIHAGALTLGAIAPHRTQLDCYPVARQMRDGIADRALPLEANVAVTGLHRQACHDHAAHAGPVEIELGIAEPIRKKLPARYDFGADDVAIERVGTLPVGHVDDAMVKFHRQDHGGPHRAL